MTVEISDRELLNVVHYFNGPGAWGGNSIPEALAIAEIHEALNIESLAAGKAQVNTDTFSDTPNPHDLSPLAHQVLCALLSRKVQDNGLGRLGAQALKRIMQTEETT